MRDVNELYRERGWGLITDRVLRIEPEHVESQARRVAEYAYSLQQRIAELEAQVKSAQDTLQEVHAWAVCGGIATPEDMVQNLPRIIEITKTSGVTP